MRRASKSGAPRCHGSAGLSRISVASLAAMLLVVPLFGCGGADDAGDANDADVPREAGPATLDIREERDGLWLDSAGEPRRLTAARVDGFDYEALAAKQREGEVILYWAAAPVPSPDGRLIAFATNREAVAADTSGQSIWLVDRTDGTERPLLNVSGHSYRPVAWLGGDVVYIGDEAGVWTVDPTSLERRRLSSGTWIAAAEDGGAVAVADDVPADPRIEVITPTDRIAVPPAPSGAVYLAQATFEDGGRRLLLEATADSGYSRTRFEFDVTTRGIRRIE